MRRLRSSHVVLGGMGALALTLTSCGSSEPDKRCVDRISRELLPDYKCSSSSGSSGSGSGGSGGGSYYYGGSARDGRAEGGSFNKSSVQRGGFGCSGTGGG
ncbi:hypothetical protein [Streptomyces sp. TRM49041]|uniref:hypothetical protein n=1 Tax=Streptomyces sp. TRM49041 TaxID=2603216 RepID=UPI0011EFA963|nr:hypothetical protein [Streptomyces sp. TRM49041]